MKQFDIGYYCRTRLGCCPLKCLPFTPAGVWQAGQVQPNKPHQALDLSQKPSKVAARFSQAPAMASSWPTSSLSGTLPVLAICVTKMRTISEVDAPSRLLTRLALSKSGFSIRQRNITVMLQLCLAPRVGSSSVMSMGRGTIILYLKAEM